MPAITYKFTDLLRFETIAELPLKAVTFTKAVGSVGPWAGTLNVEDRGVQETNFVAATSVGKTAMWVDIDGVLVYGGLVTKRVYDPTAGTVAVSGSDFCQYLAMRLQAQGYTNYIEDGREWLRDGSPVLNIAYTILKHAFEVENSIPLKVVAQGIEAEESNWITFSAPIAQEQTLAALISQLQELGFMVGIDYACDVAYDKGRPTATITISYPRRGAQGRGPGTPEIDMTAATQWGWEEDSTAQATAIIEQAGATNIRSSPGEWEPAVAAGYPLYEACIQHPAQAPSDSPEQQLIAYLQGDLATNAFPYSIPAATLPLFGSPSILNLEAGDNAILRVPRSSGNLPPACPIFVDGLELLSRVIRIDATVPDEGVPTMALAFNAPPAFQPADPVIWTTGGSRTEPGREKEEERTKEEAEEKEREEIEPIIKEAEEFAEEAIKLAEENANEEAELEAREAKLKAEEAKTLAEAEAARELALEARTEAKTKHGTFSISYHLNKKSPTNPISFGVGGIMKMETSSATPKEVEEFAKGERSEYVESAISLPLVPGLLTISQTGGPGAEPIEIWSGSIWGFSPHHIGPPLKINPKESQDTKEGVSVVTLTFAWTLVP